MADAAVVASLVTGIATVLAASLAAVVAIFNGRAVGHVRRNVETNHGGTLGTHMEDLIDWARWHQEADNDVREALGLERVHRAVTRMPVD